MSLLAFKHSRSHGRSSRLFSLPILGWSLLLLALSACIAPQSAFAGSPLVRLHGHVPTAITGATAGAELPAGQSIRLAFVLPLRNRPQLEQLVRRLYDPKDPLYGHYLTPAQFAAQFGPTDADVAVIKQFAASQGLTVTSVSGNHAVVDVTAPAASVERAFGVRLHHYTRRGGTPFFAPGSDPMIPSAVAAKLVDVFGLDNARIYRP